MNDCCPVDGGDGLLRNISEESKFNIHCCENYRPCSQLLRVFQLYTVQ